MLLIQHVVIVVEVTKVNIIEKADISLLCFVIMHKTKDRVELSSPPKLDFILKTQKDVGGTVYKWCSDKIKSQHPTDILLITANDDEFNACYSFMNENQVQRSSCAKLGVVYFGRFGDNNKVSLIKCNPGPQNALIAVKNAAEILKPKVAVAVGICSSMNPTKAKLGDVIIPRKLATYDLRKVSESGTEYCGPRETISRNMGKLITNASDGWRAPLKSQNNSEFKVEIHSDAMILSGSEVCDNSERRQELARVFPNALGLERVGAGKLIKKLTKLHFVNTSTNRELIVPLYQ